MRYAVVATISILLAALIGAWLWLVASGQGQRQALETARHQALATITRIEAKFNDAMAHVNQLLGQADQTIADHTFDSLRTDTQFAANFGKLATQTPDVQSLWLTDAQGKVVFGDPTELNGLDIANSDFFLAHFRDGALSFIGAWLNDSDNGHLTPFSRRLERAGLFSGVIFATVKPAWFKTIAEDNDPKDDIGFAILTGQGAVVASTWDRISEIDAALRRDLAQRALHSNEFVTSTTTIGKGAAGEDMLLSYRRMKGINLVALYAVPYVTALQTWTYQLWIGSGIVALAVTIVLAGAVLLLVYGRRQGDLYRVIGLRTAEAAQAAERLALAIDTTGIGIFDYRRGKRDIAWAGVEPGYFGLRAPPALTPRTFLRCVHPADRRALMKRLRTIKTARNDTRFDTEFRLRHPEFGAIWVAARAKLFTRSANGNGEGSSGRLIGTLRDITERRHLQEHRETVLREINHRIKNSLQLMNSIMNLQSRRITSSDERARFESARRRLISLATVYAHLDDTTQPDTVDLVPFLRRLCQDFSVAYMADGRISLTFAATGARLIAATLAVPLGMAMGEILVNISLNGFAPQTTGIVAVEVAVEGDQVRIAIRHTGRKIDETFHSDGANLGRLLVDAFVDQLGGVFRAENSEIGVVFTLSFRAPPVHANRPIVTATPERSLT